MLYIPQPLESRKYFIDLTPKILFAKSDVLPLLVKSRVNRYLEFKPLSSFHTFENDSFDRVPGTKEDIFTDQTLSLMTKRNLMRFMKFVYNYDDAEPDASASATQKNTPLWLPYANKPVILFMREKFKLEPQQITELVYSIGLSTSPDISTINGLARMKRYLVSLGAYGSFPALYSTYGSAAELIQAFSRSAAVGGATYKLNTSIVSYKEAPKTKPEEEEGVDALVTLSDGSRIRVKEHVILSANSLMKIAAAINPLVSSKESSFNQDIGKRDVKPTAASTTTSGIGNSLLQQQQQSQSPQISKPTEPSSSLAGTSELTRIVAIVAKDCKEWFSEGEQAAVVVFPPKTLPSENRFAVQAIVMGSGTGQCPKGQAIWYLSSTDPYPSRARIDLEEALKKLEASILRESTEDFAFADISENDVSVRPDGLPVLSSIKLGQSLQNFVPKERLQYLLKLCYTQRLNTPPDAYVGTVEQSWGTSMDLTRPVYNIGSNKRKEEDEEVAADAKAQAYTPRKVTVAPCPLSEISYDGVVDQTLQIYEKIVGSDDDFFDLDFDDEDEAPPPSSATAASRAASSSTIAPPTGAGADHPAGPGAITASQSVHNESAIEDDDDDEDMLDDDGHVPDFGDDMEL